MKFLIISVICPVALWVSWREPDANYVATQDPAQEFI